MITYKIENSQWFSSEREAYSKELELLTPMFKKMYKLGNDCIFIQPDGLTRKFTVGDPLINDLMYIRNSCDVEILKYTDFNFSYLSYSTLQKALEYYEKHKLGIISDKEKDTVIGFLKSFCDTDQSILITENGLALQYCNRVVINHQILVSNKTEINKSIDRCKRLKFDLSLYKYDNVVNGIRKSSGDISLLTQKQSIDDLENPNKAYYGDGYVDKYKPIFNLYNQYFTLFNNSAEDLVFTKFKNSRNSASMIVSNKDYTIEELNEIDLKLSEALVNVKKDNEDNTIYYRNADSWVTLRNPDIRLVTQNIINTENYSLL